MKLTNSIWHDLRHGARVFVKHPGFTAIAVMSIALGTGANVAIFSMTDALLLRPLPVTRPSEIVTVGSRVKRGMATINVASHADYVDIRDRVTTFDGLAAFHLQPLAITTKAGASPQVRLVTIVSGNFFQVLGIEPEIGRGFLPEDDIPATPRPVVVLSFAMWQSTFASDPDVVGRMVRIAGLEFGIAGVAPQRFTGLHPFVRDTVYIPIAMLPKVSPRNVGNPLTARDNRMFTVKGRLKPEMTISRAQAEVSTIGADLERAYPATNTGFSLRAETELAVRIEQRPLDSALVIILTVLSMAVLAVACANVAGLLSSRAPARAREMSLRLALGASRGRVIRQLMTESLGIAVGGGVAGLGVGWLGILLLRQIRFPTEIVSLPVIELDERTLVFSLVVSVVCALLFGLGPAIQTTRIDLMSVMKASDTGGHRRQRLTGRNVLVAMQVALSLVVMTIAALSVGAFRHELVHGPGFRTDHLVKVTLDPSQARYDRDRGIRYFEQLLEESRALAGVTASSVTSAMPFFSFSLAQIVPDGFQVPDGQAAMSAVSNFVDETYFHTMAIPLLSGRAFARTDTLGAPRVAIVNETLARHYWPDQPAIGKTLRLLNDSATAIEIVGVAKTTQYFFPGEARQDAVYFPFRQDSGGATWRDSGSMTLLVGTSGDSDALVQPLRALLAEIDPAVPSYDAQTIERFYDARVRGFGDVMVQLIAGMGLMGLFLTTVGLYGLVSYGVGRRTREIGIRIAIGASHGRVLGMVLSQGMRPAWFGLAAGLVASVGTARLLSDLVPNTLALDPRLILIVTPLLLVVTLLAAFVPARRAARINPTVALRYD